MGGLKRKIKIEKIERKSVKCVTFTKRRNGLFRKAAELCRVSPETQIAILATPLSSNSHASFYSFGHSSVDHVVSSLLHDHSPCLPTNQENNNNNNMSSSGLGFWWEDEGLDSLESVDELKDAVDSVSKMLNNVRLRLDVLRSNQREGGLVIHQDEENNEETHHDHHINICEGASGSGNLLQMVVEDHLPFDDFDFSTDDYKI